LYTTHSGICAYETGHPSIAAAAKLTNAKASEPNQTQRLMVWPPLTSRLPFLRLLEIDFSEAALPDAELMRGILKDTFSCLLKVAIFS
jgi:hypothetical protein